MYTLADSVGMLIVFAFVFGTGLIISATFTGVLLLIDIFFKTHIGRRFCRWLFSED